MPSPPPEKSQQNGGPSLVAPDIDGFSLVGQPAVLADSGWRPSLPVLAVLGGPGSGKLTHRSAASIDLARVRAVRLQLSIKHWWSVCAARRWRPRWPGWSTSP